MNPIEQKKFDPKTGAEVKKAPAAGREPKPHPHTAGANKFLSPGAPRSYDGSPTPTPAPSGAEHQGLIDHILKAIGDFMTKPQETQEQSQANAAEKAKRAAAGHLVEQAGNRNAPERNPAAAADEAEHDGSPAHPGFQAVEGQIAAKEGIPKANAGAILASASRKASKGAKKANPALRKVKG